MTPELKHALKVIRDECKKHDRCQNCPLGMLTSGGKWWDCRLLHGECIDFLPYKWNIEAWEKENENELSNDKHSSEMVRVDSERRKDG